MAEIVNFNRCIKPADHGKCFLASIIAGCCNQYLLTGAQGSIKSYAIGLPPGKPKTFYMLSRSELQWQNTHTGKITAMDALKRLGDHCPHTQKPRSLGSPIPAAAHAVVLSGNDNGWDAPLLILTCSLVNAHHLTAGKHGCVPAFSTRRKLIAKPDMCKRAPYHDLVVAAARAVLHRSADHIVGALAGKQRRAFARLVRDGWAHWNGATPQQSVDIAATLDAILRSARGGGVAVAFFIGARLVASVFSGDPRVVEVIVSYIRIISFGYGMMEVHRYSGFFLTGLHRPREATLLNAVRVVVLLIPLSYAGALTGRVEGVFAGRLLTDLLAGATGLVWASRACASADRKAARTAAARGQPFSLDSPPRRQ